MSVDAASLDEARKTQKHALQGLCESKLNADDRDRNLRKIISMRRELSPRVLLGPRSQRKVVVLQNFWQDDCMTRHLHPQYRSLIPLGECSQYNHCGHIISFPKNLPTVHHPCPCRQESSSSSSCGLNARLISLYEQLISRPAQCVTAIRQWLHHLRIIRASVISQTTRSIILNFGNQIPEIDCIDVFRMKFSVHIAVVGQSAENLLVDRDIAIA
ncbi:hypothetical protein E4U34_002658 [Claviceps purpurea]|nr:hypothetical protein E4U34_002658 [Claviceps purpurea]